MQSSETLPKAQNFLILFLLGRTKYLMFLLTICQWVNIRNFNILIVYMRILKIPHTNINSYR